MGAGIFTKFRAVTSRDQILLRIEAIAAGLSGLALLMTLAWPDWIEAVFRSDPDHGDGSVEWVIVAALLVLTAAFGYLARRKWLRLALSERSTR